MKLIKKDEFKDSNWAGGITSEIFIYPEDATVGEKNFDFRISSASCNLEKSIYTNYDGFLRYISPLDNSMTITTDAKKFSLRPFEVLFFNGKSNTFSTGDVRDFNLIYKKNLNAQMYSLNINNYKNYFKGHAIIFNFNSKLKYEDEKFPEFSALYLKNEEVNLKGQGKVIICQIY